MQLRKHKTVGGRPFKIVGSPVRPAPPHVYVEKQKLRPAQWRSPRMAQQLREELSAIMPTLRTCLLPPCPLAGGFARRFCSSLRASSVD